MKKRVPLFAIFLKLAGRRCLVAGGGKISEGKISGLLETGARIEVVAPEVTPRIESWSRERKIRWKRREFRPADLDGAVLVVAATNSSQVHRRIYREARKRKVLCNVVDVPELCDFYYPAVVRRGDLQIAISTAGASPSLAKRLRQEMEAIFGQEYEEWVARLAEDRKKVLGKRLDAAQKMEVLKEQASAEAFSRFLKQQRKTLRGKRK